jgi:hypothetical protein
MAKALMEPRTGEDMDLILLIDYVIFDQRPLDSMTRDHQASLVGDSGMNREAKVIPLNILKKLRRFETFCGDRFHEAVWKDHQVSQKFSQMGG